jgi:hypothetical protein
MRRLGAERLVPADRSKQHEIASDVHLIDASSAPAGARGRDSARLQSGGGSTADAATVLLLEARPLDRRRGTTVPGDAEVRGGWPPRVCAAGAPGWRGERRCGVWENL